VVASPKHDRRQRRDFTTEYKERIVREIDACSVRGQVGALRCGLQLSAACQSSTTWCSADRTNQSCAARRIRVEEVGEGRLAFYPSLGRPRMSIVALVVMESARRSRRYGLRCEVAMSAPA
jgi:hypothetical protein